MNFSDALSDIKGGSFYTRQGWNGKGLFVQAQIPDEYSKMSVPYLFITIPPEVSGLQSDIRSPWLPSESDLFAEDWVEVGHKNDRA